MLARIVSDCPPDRNSFCGKLLHTDDEATNCTEFARIFSHGNPGKVMDDIAQAEEQELAIRRSVRRGEEQAIECLRGLLVQALENVNGYQKSMRREADGSRSSSRVTYLRRSSLGRPGSGSSILSDISGAGNYGNSIFAPSSFAPSTYAPSSYGNLSAYGTPSASSASSSHYARRSGSKCSRSVRLSGLSAIASESGSPGSTRAPSEIGGGRSSSGRAALRSLSGSRPASKGAVLVLGSIVELPARLQVGSEHGPSLEQLDEALFAQAEEHFEAPYELPLVLAPNKRIILGLEGKGSYDGVLSRQLCTAPAAAPVAPAKVTLEQKLAHLRSLQFTRELQMPLDMLTQVADWLEVQTFERHHVISAETSWCHSLFILAHGVAEVHELGVGVQKSPLEPGSYWGESALAPELRKLPLPFSVVAVEPCVLLVLRQSKLQQKLSELVPFMGADWLEEAQRVHRMHSELVMQWRLRSLRRVRRLLSLAPPLLQELNELLSFRVLADSAVLQRQGRPVDSIVLVLHGEVALFGGEAETPRLVRIVSSRSAVPLLGVDALDALAAAASARREGASPGSPGGFVSPLGASALGASPTTALTRGVSCAVLVCPVAELAQHEKLLRALAKAFCSETPRGLMARLEPRRAAGGGSPPRPRLDDYLGIAFETDEEAARACRDLGDLGASRGHSRGHSRGFDDGVSDGTSDGGARQQLGWERGTLKGLAPRRVVSWSSADFNGGVMFGDVAGGA